MGNMSNKSYSLKDLPKITSLLFPESQVYEL